ncbi:hypothetical protein EVAR_61376_1 [Eumeta japonica]|uniref:Uncharacterized protein n=1 Tax=Eumeta variegata TaxID=151549 RepID=A0A4C1ZAI0_EUMVA|nr:hypothetical protein EVAR_61376_1 [Eumeta japonica]
MERDEGRRIPERQGFCSYYFFIVISSSLLARRAEYVPTLSKLELSPVTKSKLQTGRGTESKAEPGRVRNLERGQHPKSTMGLKKSNFGITPPGYFKTERSSKNINCRRGGGLSQRILSRRNRYRHRNRQFAGTTVIAGDGRLQRRTGI